MIRLFYIRGKKEKNKMTKWIWIMNIFFCFSWMMNRKNIMIQFLMLICFFCLSLSFSAKKSFFYYLFYKKWFQRNHRICLLFNSIWIWFYVKIVYINLNSSCHAVWNDLTYIIIEQQVHTSSMSYMIIILSLSHSFSVFSSLKQIKENTSQPERPQWVFWTSKVQLHVELHVHFMTQTKSQKNELIIM